MNYENVNSWRSGSLKKDEEVVILYSLNNPKNIELKAYLWTGQLLMAFFAFCFIFLGWLLRRGIIACGPLKQSYLRIGL
jgi:hypothetical protein